MSTALQSIMLRIQRVGADGLVFPAECGCELSDLAPCQGDPGDCVPGWKGKPEDPSDEWAMYPSKAAAQRSWEPQT